MRKFVSIFIYNREKASKNNVTKKAQRVTVVSSGVVLRLPVERKFGFTIGAMASNRQ
ncbi:hypothetical protein [Roseibium album]|uniref:hypothetical protein n=1 Tax=Roseibium album TaxID=311410 RepID=UPI00130E25F3|nr:hypothetical protein [Roseibium album]